MSLADYQALLPRLVREQGSHVTSTDVDRAIASAVRQYSTDVPRQVVKDYTWTAAGFTSSGLPSGMAVDSTVLRAEYPVGQQPPALLDLAIMLTTGAAALVCATSLPAGAVVRITFTAEHELTNGMSPKDTVPLKHRDAVAHYAAHLLCRELATLYSAERESSIAADGSNTDSRARNYAARAREFRSSYYAAIGVADPMATGNGGGGAGAASGTNGASAVVSWGSRPRPSWRTNDSGVSEL